MTTEGEAQLRTELLGLQVDDILQLCYAFSKRSERLRLYLDVLRSGGGQRAQFAACLICFDLARQGDSQAQADFILLAHGVRTLAKQEQEMIATLIGDDSYLQFVWELLECQLDEMDDRFDTQERVAGNTVVTVEANLASFDLLSDDDFADEDLGMELADDQLEELFSVAVDQFLGRFTDRPSYHPEAGFRLRNRRDTTRLEALLEHVDSLHTIVPKARGYRALTLLFYGSKMRSKNFFGSLNERKQRILRDGLTEFLSSGAEMSLIAGVMSSEHADPKAWSQIAELIYDYLRWSTLQSSPWLGDPKNYPAVQRLMTRDAARPSKWRLSLGG